MYCVDIDLRDRKAADERVNKLLLAVEQSPESIVITDLSGSIEYANDAFSRNSGYSREEANSRLARQHGMVASFSRALTEGLSAQQSDTEFNAMLDAYVERRFGGDVGDGATAAAAADARARNEARA